MTNVFYRNPGSGYPLAVRGKGVYLYDAEGREYLDGSGGAAICCLGHAHPAVVTAVRDQISAMGFAHTVFFTNEPQERLAACLADRFPAQGAKSYFVSGGSEATETAIKLARQYWRARGSEDKYIVISRRQSYHGNTLGALSVSGQIKRRAAYQPMLHDWPRIAPCHAWRFQDGGESLEEYGHRAADELEAAILATGAERVSAFIAETVAGASLGAVAAAPGYFARIRDICDRHEVLLILDEVMAGSGRTGSYFAFEQEGVVPDLVTLAKGLGGGYQPLGAVVASARVHDTIEASGQGFSHGHTYAGHATACAAGLAVQQVLEDEGLLHRVSQMESTFRGILTESFGHHPQVGDIRVRGLLAGLELVNSRANKEPVSASRGLPMRIRAAAMAEGLVCYPGGGTADGVDGAHILLAPPFIITSDQMEEVARRLRRALDLALDD